MAKVLDRPRYKCALAAMQTVQAIPRVIPILHAGPGCGAKLNDNYGTSGMYSPNIFPCTSFSEKEVVFGGSEKLRDTIANSLKIIDADMFVVLSGCTAEIIGDDIAEVAGSFRNAEKPVLYANTPGFKGNNYLGHDWILKAIFEQRLTKPLPKVAGQVNLFAGPPVQDPFWLGNLRELERLVGSLGLKVNTIFGHGRGIANIDAIPAASANILVSPWSGAEAVGMLRDRFDTPFLHYPVLPIGAFETSAFLRAVAEFAGVPKKTADEVTLACEAEYYYYIERYADTFMELRIMPRRFVTVADAQYTLAATKFLVNDLGKFPLTQFITDDTPEGYRDGIRAELRKLNYGIEAEVEFETDGRLIHEKIRDFDFGGLPLIIGTSWEQEFTKSLGGHFINISYPMIERLVINGTLAGYSGGLKFLEDIFTTAMGKLIL